MSSFQVRWNAQLLAFCDPGSDKIGVISQHDDDDDDDDDDDNDGVDDN